MHRKFLLGAALAAAASVQSASAALIYDPVRNVTYETVNTAATWSAAEAAAVANGGHLVSINSAATNNLVHSLLGGSKWIGFNDVATEGTFVWSDGSPVVYTNWNGGEPNNSGNEDFAELGPGWNDLPGSSTRNAIYQYSGLRTVEGPNGHKYAIIAPQADYAAAEALAVSLGGHLVSIGSAAENAFVQGLFAGSSIPRAFIGFNDIATEGTFVWTDGSAVTFTNWAGGEPNNVGNEDAGEMNTSNGLWNDIPTNFQAFAVVEFLVPEPASALLGIIGAGVLGLRRTRREA